MRKEMPNPDLLNEAIAAWRRSEQAPQALRPETRSRVVESAWAEFSKRGPAGFRPLFVPRRWFAGLAVVSFVIVGAVAVMIQQEQVADRPVQLAAHKVGDEVVFTIANGNRAHSVKKATHPALLERAQSVTVRNGRYSDAAHDEAAIVFYRVD